MKKVQKLLSLLLAIIMVATIIPSASIMAMAQTSATKATITVDNVNAMPNSTVDVNVSINDNPGVLGAILTITYDEGLELIGADNGDAFSALALTKPGQFTSPCNFTWDSLEIASEDIKNGVVLTLHFKASESLKSGDKCNISVSSEYGDITDNNLNPIDMDFINGSVSIINYIPGDLNGDTKVNINDVILMRRFIAGGYNVTINESAADVNDDSKINMTDVIILRRFLTGGYGNIELLPGNVHKHTLEVIERKEATCTETGNITYWQCSLCNKYYSDQNAVNLISNLEAVVIAAKGHNPISVPEVEPTYTTTGLTEGKKCSICNEILVPQIEIPVIVKDEYIVTYKVNPNDSYLATQDIYEAIREAEESENKSYTMFSSDEGLTDLPTIEVKGYNFIGWAESAASTAPIISSIPANTKKNITLYAKFEKVPFTVSLDCGEAAIANNEIEYYVDQTKSLGNNPSMTGFTFLGWSDDQGNLWNNIPIGTTGNFTLHANWISERNKAVPLDSLGKPVTFEDESTGSYMFLYEIGTIYNVPLYTVNDYGYMVKGAPVTTTSKTVSGKITESNAKTLANTVSNATTKTSTWTLSKDWNSVSTISENHAQSMGIDTSTVKFDQNTSSIQLSGSKTNGGSTSTTDNFGVNAKIYGSSKTEVGAEAKFPVKVVNVGVSAKQTYEVGGEIGGHYDHTKVNDSYWNTQNSYNLNSGHTSSLTTSTNISKQINDNYGYSTSKSEGGSQSSSEAVATSKTETQEYSSTVAYETETVETTTESTTKSANVTGYWREIVTGKMHVFGVVAYDMATSTYTVYTYSVLDSSNPQYFMDFSTSPDYNDYENGFIKFEVPFEVNDFISQSLGYSEGLVINRNTGIIEEYDGNAEHIHIPDYMTINNGDGTYTPIKVTGISSNAFSNHANITSVRLGKYITKIPDDAFNGCSSLKTIEYNELTSIGNNAFKGCVSLDPFTVEDTVTNLGTKAFENVPSVIINASKSSVAVVAAGCGATKVTLNLKALKDELTNTTLVVANSTNDFVINGRNNDKAVTVYNGVRIESNAESTTVNGMKFQNNTGVPLKFKSSNVTLNNVTIEKTPDLALIIDSNSVNLYLQGTNNISSTGVNAILCKNPTIIKNPSSNETNSLNVSNGLFLYCGTFTDERNYYYGEKKEISEEAFENYLNGSLDWVLASEVPSGATIVNQKWTYDETVTKTSSSSTVPSGYTLSNTSWVWGSYGSWSGWSTTKYTASDSRQVESQNVAATYKTQYNYSRYYNAARTRYGPVAGTWSGTYCGNKEEKGWSDSKLSSYSSQTSNQYKAVYGTSTFYCYGSTSNPWYNETTRQVVKTAAYTQYRYRDRSKVYTYYFTKKDSYESTTEIASSDTISNVKHWVQYVV